MIQQLTVKELLQFIADVTAAEVDKEVMALLRESYEEAKRLLAAHRNTLDQIAAFLIEKETITGEEFMNILHNREEDDNTVPFIQA